MAIPAQPLWVMVRLIRMTTVTNLPLGHFPLMGYMTRRTIHGRVSGSKVQLAALGVARIASRYGFEILFFEMTRAAREACHRRVSGADMTSGAIPDHASSPRVTPVTT